MSEALSSKAWVLDPAWLAFLGGYRLFNHIGTTWHYLADGMRVQEVGGAYKALSKRHRAGDKGEPVGTSGLFRRWGHGLTLRRAAYEQASSSLLAEQDLSVVVARRDGSCRHSWPVRTPEQLISAGTLLSRLSPVHDASAYAEIPRLRAWWLRLKLAGVVVPTAVVALRSRPAAYVLRAMGHAGLSIETPTTRVLVDPVLTLRYRADVDRLAELDGPVDAVLLTQPQWGHLNIDTLLHVERSVPIYVKRREQAASLDNVDMVKLARELGFTTVIELDLWQGVAIGDITVTALPFRGVGLGQGSAPDWMTLLFELGGRRVYVTANACRDQRGTQDEIVRELRRRIGRVHVVVAGYLDYWYPVSWFTRRPFYLGPGREQATTAPGDGVRWATLLEAEVLLPYAGFAWNERELWRPPVGKVLYGGVVQRGCLHQVVRSLGGWRTPATFALAPGAELRWRFGEALRAVDSKSRPVAPLVGLARLQGERGSAS